MSKRGKGRRKSKQRGIKSRAEHEKEELELGSMMDWPFKISIDLAPMMKNRVAFMSSASRTFFPKNPGHSRFAVHFKMNTAPVDIPKANFMPSEEHIRKPISRKGYSIGGLSGPRFAKDVMANNPPPNAYQASLTPKIIRKRSIRRKSRRRRSSEEPKKSAEDVESHALAALRLPPPEVVPPSKEKLRQLCFQTFSAFGSHLSVDRFGREKKFHNVGVAHYDIAKKPAEIDKQGSFGKPVKLIPPVSTRCNFEGYDKCFECDDLLDTVDYYRTWKKIQNPFYNVSQQDRVATNDKDNIYLREADQHINPEQNHKQVFISLCRKCYCRGMRGESRFWEKKKMVGLFNKTRHCSYIHEHNNFPIFTHKTSCNVIRRLQRQEILMAKYYKDACEKVYKPH